MPRPIILVTSDDGIASPGLLAAARAACKLGQVLIVAPPHDQSAMGRSYPKIAESGSIMAVSLDLPVGGIRSYSIVGSPALAVAHGVLELSKRLPSLCIAGVNCGENVGADLTASGTIGAAMEAHSYGIPTIAVAQQMSPAERDRPLPANSGWEPAIATTCAIGERVLSTGLPSGVALLNVNIPAGATTQTRVVETRQAEMDYYVFTKPANRDLSRPSHLAVTVNPRAAEADEGTDVHALAVRRCISVTPLAATFQHGAKLDDLLGALVL